MDDATNKAVERAEHRLAGRCIYCGATTDKLGNSYHKTECNVVIAQGLGNLQVEITRMAGDLAAIRSQLITPNGPYGHEMQDLVNSFNKISEVLQRRANRSRNSGGSGNPF